MHFSECHGIINFNSVFSKKKIDNNSLDKRKPVKKDKVKKSGKENKVCSREVYFVYDNLSKNS